MHGLLRRAADGECGLVSGLLAQSRRVAPERLAEAAVPPARAVSADLGLEQDDVGVRLELEQVPRRPEPEVAATDDDDVRRGVALERARRDDLAGLLEPPPVSRVAHAAVRYDAAGVRRAIEKLSAITTAAAIGTMISQKSGNAPAAAPTEARIPASDRRLVEDGVPEQDQDRAAEEERDPERGLARVPVGEHPDDARHCVDRGEGESGDPPDQDGAGERHRPRTLSVAFDRSSRQPEAAAAAKRTPLGIFATGQESALADSSPCALKNRWRTGLEPATTGTTTRGSTN